MRTDAVELVRRELPASVSDFEKQHKVEYRT